MKKVLLTGATGFVGERLVRELIGTPLRCASRKPEHAAKEHPEVEWVRLDVSRPETLKPAMEGCSAAVYLVHGMEAGGAYAREELAGARAFAAAAQSAGLERIVYLGGVAPHGQASAHLASRLRTGEVLREGTVAVFELRAAMIIGQGSASWRIVRDLAVRLPVMVLPQWLQTESQPVCVDDVVFAIAEALRMPIERAGVYDLPGPEVMSAKAILFRAAQLRGTRPRTIDVPFITPTLSSYWLKLVTSANYKVARELVQGLTSSLVSTGTSFWQYVPSHTLVSFDEAARRAMAENDVQRSLPTALVEGVLHKVSSRVRPMGG